MLKEARETKNFDKPELKCLAACMAKKAGFVSDKHLFSIS